MTTINTGAPHFKSVIKQKRSSNYTLDKVINEFTDNIIKKTDQIKIYTQVDDNGKLQQISISDNYAPGFENIEAEGYANPFNMGYMCSNHQLDTETSEFGVGMKAGAISAANQLQVFTRYIKNNTIKYAEIICDFLKMENEKNVNDSYNPIYKLISENEYHYIHPKPFLQGSTILLTKIRDCIFQKTSQEHITEFIKTNLSFTYSRFIKSGIQLYVNDVLVPPMYDYFEDSKCIPFSIFKELFILEKGDFKEYIIKKIKEQNTKTKNTKIQNTKELVVWQKYNFKDQEWISLKCNKDKDGFTYLKELLDNGYKYSYEPFTNDGQCMGINTTFTFYSDQFHFPNSNGVLPDDGVNIYKDDRCYGKQPFLKHKNGIHNYTQHEIDFISKKMGKDIGITFNKDIQMSGTNDLINIIKAAIKDSREEFTADISSKKNYALCEKAIKKNIITLMDCPEAKLSSEHRSERSKQEEKIRLENLSNAQPEEPEEVIMLSLSSKKKNKTNKSNLVISDDWTNNIVNGILNNTNSNKSNTNSNTFSFGIQKDTNTPSLHNFVQEFIDNNPNRTDRELGLKVETVDSLLVSSNENEDNYKEEKEMQWIHTNKTRTIQIIDYLQKTLLIDDTVLSDEALEVFENLCGFK